MSSLSQWNGSAHLVANCPAPLFNSFKMKKAQSRFAGTVSLPLVS